MPGCSKANKHSISPHFRTSQLPHLITSKPPDFSLSPQDSQLLFLLKRSAPLAPVSWPHSFPASRPHSLPASSPPSFPSFPASQLPSFPAYSIILYFSLIAFSTSAGMYDFSSTARIFFAISRARVRVSLEPFSIHFSRLFWSDTPLPLKYS